MKRFLVQPFGVETNDAAKAFKVAKERRNELNGSREIGIYELIEHGVAPVTPDIVWDKGGAIAPNPRKTKHRRWTVEETVKMLDMVKDGKTYAAIGKELDRTTLAVGNKAFLVNNELPTTK